MKTIVLLTLITLVLSPTCHVTPIVECIDLKDDIVFAHWGYRSSYEGNIPIGEDNKFTTGTENQGQPTIFKLGRHRNLFVTSFELGESSTWKVRGRQATANAFSPECEPNSVVLKDLKTNEQNELFLLLICIFLSISILLLLRGRKFD